jgi:midasin (ATPase involved in ribosome maturation)
MFYALDLRVKINGVNLLLRFRNSNSNTISLRTASRSHLLKVSTKEKKRKKSELKKNFNEFLIANIVFATSLGTLVKSVQNGQFILLDEINLAPSETLESLSGLLEGKRETRERRIQRETKKFPPIYFSVSVFFFRWFIMFD